MTKKQFLESVPPSIVHKNWGYGKLKTTSDKESKSAEYVHNGNFKSGGSLGKSWLEVYLQIEEFLKSPVIEGKS